MKHFFSKLIGKTYILQSGRPAWRPYRKSAVREDSAFFLFKLIDSTLQLLRCLGS